jgi:ribosomal protein S18 acetylase RimI-like enzyme
MDIREAEIKDIEDLQELYLKHLTKYPPKEVQLKEKWVMLLDKLIQDKNYHLLVGTADGKVVSSVTIVIIQNLTHDLRPYSVIENVVTHGDYRNRGYASELLSYATDIAVNENCYKIMLMTGSKKESTLDFYKKNGFDADEKTAFIKRLY